MKRLIYLAPLAVFLVLAGYFAVGLTKDPRRLESVLIDQPVPEFDLPPIEGYGQGFRNADLMGQVTLVNIWGSWCISCKVEHPFLMRISEETDVPLYGIDWRDTPEAALAWLKKYGDPYRRIGYDPDSKAAIAFGVTGAPETFVVDKQGVIRYKHAGPLDQTIWNETLWPIIEKLRAQ